AAREREAAVGVLPGGEPAQRPRQRARRPGDAGGAQRQDAERRRVDEAAPGAVAALCPPQVGEQVAAAYRGATASRAQREHRALDVADAAHRGPRPSQVAGERAAAALARPGEAYTGPRRVQRRGRLASRPAEAAVAVLCRAHVV